MEKLFERLEAMYGSQFLNMWASSDLTLVKEAWAEDLGAFGGPQIQWALNTIRLNANGAHNFPPNLPTFRNLCAQAPRQSVPALPAPEITLEQVAKRSEDLGKIRAKSTNAGSKDWARRIVANPKNYPACPHTSLKFAKAVLGIES